MTVMFSKTLNTALLLRGLDDCTGQSHYNTILGSIEVDSLISELLYKGIILL